MLKRLLLLAGLAIISTPALAQGQIIPAGPPHCPTRVIYYLYYHHYRQRRVTVYGTESFYENLYRNQFSRSPYYNRAGNNSAYHATPEEPVEIINPFFVK